MRVNGEQAEKLSEVMASRFYKMFPEFKGEIESSYYNSTRSVGLVLGDGTQIIFGYYSPDNWAFGKGTLYDRKKRYRIPTDKAIHHRQYKYIPHDKIRVEFEILFPKLASQVVSWSPCGSRSIRVTLKDKRKFVFTYYSPKKWSIGQTIKDHEHNSLCTMKPDSHDNVLQKGYLA